MSKELNIIEAINMPVGTEFKITFGDDGTTEKVFLEETNDKKGKVFKWCICNSTDYEQPFAASGFITAKFIPIQKPVSFMEAIESGKKIRVDVSNIDINLCDMNIHLNYPARLDEMLNKISAYSSNLCKKIITNGKWYIEEE